jgi:hypothetical protein
MTLQEKIGQMDQIVVGKLRDKTNLSNGDCNGGNNDQLQSNCLQKVLVTDRTGSILSGGTDNPPDNTGTRWAELYNQIQPYAIQNSRLHIPIIYGVDAVHGFGHPTQATLFPQSIDVGHGACARGRQSGLLGPGLVPSPLGDEPKFFDQFPGTNSGNGSGYNPLFPFGAGLSYTTFTTGAPSVSGPSGGTVTVGFTVSNTGGRPGADVVPVYVQTPTNSGNILRPPQQLVGFARVELAGGTSQHVSVSFRTSQLAVTPGDIDASGPRQVQAGDYDVQVGGDTAGFTIH